MAVICLAKFVQGATTGTPGQALFGVAGTPVQTSNGAASPGPVSEWTFTVVGAPSTSAVPVGVAQGPGPVTTWSFTPDVPGCFLIGVTVEDAFGNTASDARCFGVKTASGRLIPCFLGDNNSMNFGGQPTGWDVYMEAWLQALETLIDNEGAPAGILRYTAPGTIPIVGQSQSVALDYTGGGFIQPLPASAPDNFVVGFDDLSASGAFTWPSSGAGLSVAGGTKLQNPQTLALQTSNLLWSALGTPPGSGYRFRRFGTENVWKLA